MPRLNTSIEIMDVPDDKEITEACRSLKNKALGDCGLKPQLWKTLLTDDRTFHLLKSLVLDFWISELPPRQWMTGLLRILPKKGDLSLPGNYRGIMLLEAAYKIVSILLLNRLRPLAETLDREQQCGFRPGRGCSSIHSEDGYEEKEKTLQRSLDLVSGSVIFICTSAKGLPTVPGLLSPWYGLEVIIFVSVIPYLSRMW